MHLLAISSTVLVSFQLFYLIFLEKATKSYSLFHIHFSNFEVFGIHQEKVNYKDKQLELIFQYSDLMVQFKHVLNLY